MTNELFLADSYLKECEAEIMRIEGDRVLLDQTVFYPGGGGQENDTGLLMQNGREVQIVHMKKEGGLLYHIVKDPEKLAPGKAVAKIDWERRENMMKHHTLLHVIAAVFNSERSSLCTGNQISPDKARIDMTGISELGSAEIGQLIAKVNQELARNHAVSTRTLPREQAEQVSGAIKTVVNLIPPSVQEVRLVKIGDIDEQACGGTHVRNTGEVGQFRLDKTKNKGKGVTRLEVHLV